MVRVTYHSHPASANAKPRAKYSRPQISVIPFSNQRYPALTSALVAGSNLHRGGAKEFTRYFPVLHLLRLLNLYIDEVASTEERRALSRLVHRFGFGPRPGEFSQLLTLGLPAAIEFTLSRPQLDIPDSIFSLHGIGDLGDQPAANNISRFVEYTNNKKFQLGKISSLWLSWMVEGENQLLERMTWFWHGHWATSYQKVDEPYVMFKQLLTMRKYALGNFSDFAASMIMDGALVYWLDGQRNTIKAPNENLSREMMELFTLGVNRYVEADVKESARVLTGYKVNKSSGIVTFVPTLHYSQPIKLLGSTQSFDAPSLARFLVAREDCAQFIAERIWYRFISSNAPLPASGFLQKSFTSRDLSVLIKSLLSDNSVIYNPSYSQVKSPVEWMVSSLRALSISLTSDLDVDFLFNRLDAMGQRPFFPPNVGGWPADEAWLSTSSAQNRLSTAQYLASRGDLSPISSVSRASRIDALADWLGIVGFSDRTKNALSGAVNDLPRLVTLALCSPEYVVNA
ncbi:MAG: hypothetical protein RLZZ317_698 [Actinomycetota bacterium]